MSRKNRRIERRRIAAAERKAHRLALQVERLTARTLVWWAV